VAQERILIVEDSTSFAELAASLLEAEGYQTDIAHSAQEALAKLDQAIPDLFLVDVMMPGMDGLQLTRRLRGDARTANVPIIILTARSSVEDKVQGFEAGADDYLVKPFAPPELIARVRALLARRSTVPTGAAEAKPLGLVIVVFGLRGGAGRSSLTANLAVCLAESSGTETVACDMAIESGHLALMLDAQPVHTVDDLIARHGPRPEADVIMAYLAKTQYGVRLLAAPASPASASLVATDSVRPVIEHLRYHFPYVLIDTAPTFSDLNLSLLENTDLILLVTIPEVAGVKVTAAALEILDSLGYPSDRVILGVNTCFAARPLTEADIVSALNKRVTFNIPYDKSAFVNAINRGIPVVRLASRSPSSRAIVRLAAEIASKYGPATPTALSSTASQDKSR